MQIGSVRYINFDNSIVPQSRYARFFHKRSGFEDEKEFRALFEQPMAKPNSPIDPDSGKPVEVNLDQLIRKVILKPGSSDYFKRIRLAGVFALLSALFLRLPSSPEH